MNFKLLILCTYKFLIIDMGIFIDLFRVSIHLNHAWISLIIRNINI